MDIKLMVLERAVKWLVGGELLKTIKETVKQINDKAMTGEQKKAYVFKEAKKMFSQTATIVINMVIEVAVFLMKEEIKKRRSHS